MIKKVKKGYEVLSEKSGKSLGKFTVKEKDGEYAVYNSEGKRYKTFSSKSKAMNYTKYLAHKQLATVEYFKGRGNTLNEDKLRNNLALSKEDVMPIRNIDLDNWGSFSLMPLYTNTSMDERKMSSVYVGHTLLMGSQRLKYFSSEAEAAIALTDYYVVDDWNVVPTYGYSYE